MVQWLKRWLVKLLEIEMAVATVGEMVGDTVGGMDSATFREVAVLIVGEVVDLMVEDMVSKAVGDRDGR